jgi:hypothetical protein
MKTKTYTLIVALLFSLYSAVAVTKEDKRVHKDTRISLGFTASEKTVFLSEMRQMLASIQGIMMGMGTEDRALIIKSAKYSGNRMAKATPQSIKDKTPSAFDQLGGPTHMKFEELVVRAEEDDMDMLAELTGELMQNCVACHATFKVD